MKEIRLWKGSHRAVASEHCLDERRSRSGTANDEDASFDPVSLYEIVSELWHAVLVKCFGDVQLGSKPPATPGEAQKIYTIAREDGMQPI